MVVCIKCLQLRNDDLMRCTFNTGFKKIGGVDYKLGICHDCPGGCREKSKANVYENGAEESR